MQNETSPDKYLVWITSLVSAFCAESPSNRIGPTHPEPAWGTPLIAVASGSDPLFKQLKADIGDFYWTPEEAFALAHFENPAPAEQLSVISWILPHAGATLDEQRTATELPSERWSLVRQFGEVFNCDLRLHLVAELEDKGIDAVAPERLPGFDYRQSPRFGVASNWSERHTAYIAGLGTFGLSDGLITPLGKAMRCGSVVARLELPITSRPYRGLHDYCLWHIKGTCGVCMQRCPVDAINANGHDKEVCRDYIRNVTAPYANEKFGVNVTPCGLCQTAIPCETRIPPALLPTEGNRQT